MPGKQWNFGIVGCGMIAHFHAKAIASLPNARLWGVASANADNAKAVIESAGGDQQIRYFPTLSELLAAPELDILCICSPSGAHAEPAIEAAGAGKHVVVEKPLEVTLDRCDQIINACNESGVQLCAIFPSRFAPVNQLLSAAIDEGRFGRMTLIDTTVKWWRPQPYYDSGAWRGTWRLDGGGALMNQAIHNVDLLLSLGGPVREVCAFTDCLAHQRLEVEDTAVAVVRFRSGALGTITAATSAYPGLEKTIAVHAEGGSVVIEQETIRTWQFRDDRPHDSEIRARYSQPSTVSGGAGDPKAISFAGHRAQFADFLEALETGRAPKVDGPEARKAVELILAIYQSQRERRIVELPLAQPSE